MGTPLPSLPATGPEEPQPLAARQFPGMPDIEADAFTPRTCPFAGHGFSRICPCCGQLRPERTAIHGLTAIHRATRVTILRMGVRPSKRFLPIVVFRRPDGRIDADSLTTFSRF